MFPREQKPQKELNRTSRCAEGYCSWYSLLFSYAAAAPLSLSCGPTLLLRTADRGLRAMVLAALNEAERLVITWVEVLHS